MICSICREEEQGEGMFQCHNHGCHVRCLSLWFSLKSWHLCRGFDICPACTNPLPRSVKIELISAGGDVGTKLLKAVDSEDVERILKMIKEDAKLPIGPDLYYEIFMYSAAEGKIKSFSVLKEEAIKYLKITQIMDMLKIMLTTFPRTILRWATEKEDVQAKSEESFDLLILEGLAKKESYFDLLCVLSLVFQRLSERDQLKYTEIVFKSSQEGKLQRPDPSLVANIFVYIIDANPELYQYINFRIVIPTIIRHSRLDIPTLWGLEIQNSRRDVFDRIFQLCIEHNSPENLASLLCFRRWEFRPLRVMARQIAKSPYRWRFCRIIKQNYSGYRPFVWELDCLIQFSKK